VADLEETEAMLRDYIAHQEAHGFSFWAVIEPTTGSASATPGSIS
jgi:hypothetical protein